MDSGSEARGISDRRRQGLMHIRGLSKRRSFLSVFLAAVVTLGVSSATAAESASITAPYGSADHGSDCQSMIGDVDRTGRAWLRYLGQDQLGDALPHLGGCQIESTADTSGSMGAHARAYAGPSSAHAFGLVGTEYALPAEANALTATASIHVNRADASGAGFSNALLPGWGARVWISLAIHVDGCERCAAYGVSDLVYSSWDSQGGITYIEDEDITLSVEMFIENGTTIPLGRIHVDVELHAQAYTNPWDVTADAIGDATLERVDIEYEPSAPDDPGPGPSPSPSPSGSPSPSPTSSPTSWLRF